MQTWTDEALRALLCEELEAASYPVRRKQLIERSAARLGERVESRADLRPGSAVVRGKSRLGMLLTELIHSGVISEDAVGYLRVVPGQVCGVSPARVRDFVLAELKKDGCSASRPFLPVPSTTLAPIRPRARRTTTRCGASRAVCCSSWSGSSIF